MRYYDAVTGTRFDQNHPIWHSRMTNKDGSPKKRMDWKLARQLARGE